MEDVGYSHTLRLIHGGLLLFSTPVKQSSPMETFLCRAGGGGEHTHTHPLTPPHPLLKNKNKNKKETLFLFLGNTLI